MPNKKGSDKSNFRFFILTYILGLYGGIVSGAIIALSSRMATAWELWIVGLFLIALGFVIFFITNRLLGRKGN